MESRRAKVVSLALVAGLVLACTRPRENPRPPAYEPASSSIILADASKSTPDGASIWIPFPSPPVRNLTVLFTSDEHGWLVSHDGKGGIVALLAQWMRSEGYCVPEAPDACVDSPTLALSGGDNWTGPAISSYHKGKPMAEAMHAVGYVSSALGNHELDNGQPNIIENAAIQGYDFLAANVRWADGRSPLPIQPYRIVLRNKVRVGIVGLTTTATPTHLLPSSYEGLTFEDEEETLSRTIPEVWKAGADIVILTAHVCPDVLQHIVGKHPEWNIAFVGSGHCHALKSLTAGRVPVVEPAAELNWYVRVAITVDLTRPQQERAVRVQPQLVEIGTEPSVGEMTEPVKRLQLHVKKWREATDEVLGEEIGFTAQGMTKESAAMIKWLLGIWRRQAHAQVAIMNRAGMRQDLGTGVVHAADVYNILPFNNRLVTMRMTGQDLIENATCCSGLVDGMRHQGGSWILSDGKKVDSAQTYVVVTPDYTYFGGAGFRFKSQAISAEFGPDWRQPILDWMRAHKSTRGRPLESMVYR